MKFRFWITAFNFDCSIWQWFCLFWDFNSVSNKFLKYTRANFFSSKAAEISSALLRAAVPEQKNSIQFRMKSNCTLRQHSEPLIQCMSTKSRKLNERKMYTRTAATRASREKKKWKKNTRAQNLKSYLLFNSLAMLAAFRANPFECFRWYSAIAIFPVAPCWLPLISLIYCTTHPNVLDSIAFRTHHLQFRSNDCAPNLNEWWPPHSKKKGNTTQSHSFDAQMRAHENCVRFIWKWEKKILFSLFVLRVCPVEWDGCKQHSPKCSKLFCTDNRSALMTLNWFPSKRRVVSRQRSLNASSSKYSNCKRKKSWYKSWMSVFALSGAGKKTYIDRSLTSLSPRSNSIRFGKWPKTVELTCCRLHFRHLSSFNSYAVTRGKRKINGPIFVCDNEINWKNKFTAATARPAQVNRFSHTKAMREKSTRFRVYFTLFIGPTVISLNTSAGSSSNGFSLRSKYFNLFSM